MSIICSLLWFFCKISLHFLCFSFCITFFYCYLVRKMFFSRSMLESEVLALHCSVASTRPVVHGAMGCGQKSFKLVWRWYQLLSGFLAKGLLPRVSEKVTYEEFLERIGEKRTLLYNNLRIKGNRTGFIVRKK